MRVDPSPPGGGKARAATSPPRGEGRKPDAVFLLHPPVFVPPPSRAGVCRGAPLFAPLRHLGAGFCLADFLRRVEAGLPAAAGRLDRNQLLARFEDGGPAAPPHFWHARRGPQSRSSVLFQVHKLPV